MQLGLFSTEDLWTLLRLSPAAIRKLASAASAAKFPCGQNAFHNKLWITLWKRAGWTT